MEIAFCRIDDRLIHGQVATVWTKVTGCNRIMCCSDEVAKDEMRKKLLLQVAPPGIKAYVVPVEKACEAYKNPKYDAFKTLFLFTKPADVVRAVKGGIPFKSVNLGGMTYKGTKATVSELPVSGNHTGDVWHVTADGAEYAWNGSAWEDTDATD